MPRFLIQLSYDGTDFHGWQNQPDARTVQDTLENILSEIQCNKVAVTGSGRTDAGVHALRQYAHFDLDTRMSPAQIIAALNSKIPSDIRVLNCWQVPDNFSARYDAISRIYHYHLALDYSPFSRRYSAYLPRFKYSEASMLGYLRFFYGEHDFSAFARHNPDLENYICTIQGFELRKTQDELVFIIRANRFLHNMVRRIVGTCLRISHTNTEPEVITELIAARDPKNNLIYTAPPQGLFLADVLYPFFN